jgi:serine protease AprX
MRRSRTALGLAALSAASLVAGLVPAGVAAAQTTGTGTGHDPLGLMASITQLTGAEELWKCGFLGQGVDVAVIDTGIAVVPGMGRTVPGVDLSFDPLSGNPVGVDGFGHGTHLASIVNGRDPNWVPPGGTCNLDKGSFAGRAALVSAKFRSPTGMEPFSGMAPAARTVNVKVGAADGAVDVTQVIAGLDWVTQNARTDGRNIRVALLAYGTEALQEWDDDPLALAVERAVRAGVTVVISSGNDGTEIADLANPAINPNAIAVGAVDFNGSTNPDDWTVADFAQRGNSTRSPDLVVPGVSIQGLRVENGFVDTFFPESRDRTRFTRASGTSQAAAVAAGWIALLHSARPGLTPAEVKKLLTAEAEALSGTKSHQGAGALSITSALVADSGSTVTSALAATDGIANGTLDGARGNYRLVVGGVELSGEMTLWRQKWDTRTWLANALPWARSSWLGTDLGVGAWRQDYAGRRFSDPAWTDLVNYADAWDGLRWRGLRWRADAWAGLRWRSDSWEGLRWRADGWDGLRWRGLRWRSTWGG